MTTSAEPTASSTRAVCQAGGFGLDRASRAAAQPDDHVDSAVLKVQRLRAALVAIAEDRDPLAGERRGIDVGVAEQVHRAPPSRSAQQGQRFAKPLEVERFRKRGQSAGGWCANQVYWRLA